MTINAEINKEKISINLYDTMGQERYYSIIKSYIRGANGILLFFDVTNKYSFENIKNWIYDIKEVDNNDKEIILIGNKIDLVDKRVISKKKSKRSGKKI